MWRGQRKLRVLCGGTRTGVGKLAAELVEVEGQKLGDVGVVKRLPEEILVGVAGERRVREGTRWALWHVRRHWG